MTVGRRRRLTLQDVRGRCIALLLGAVIATCPASAGSGCVDGSREGMFERQDVAACTGVWQGHIQNSSSLCAPGWRVCSWYDHHTLKSITWGEAMSVDGCYAYNAAQDGGRCRECRSDLEQDDLAGIGRGCPHQNLGQTSCITGGRIDASCCVDSHFHRACTYTPGLASGVLCCKMPVKRPKIVVKPRPKMQVYTGLIFLLPCQATGMPPPRTQWYKDGTQIPRSNPRISVLSNGDLLVTLARKSDSGLYSCEVINEEGVDMASSQVTITEYSSGCSDTSKKGPHMHRDVQACGGEWQGHVKRAKTLCKRGWRVCSTRDKDVLQELSWLDIMDVKGCYAYNAANHKGACSRCHKDKSMAGIGKGCSRHKYSQSSCLSKGRIDVFKPRKQKNGCLYKEGFTTGVLCCRRRGHKAARPRPSCDPPCLNGGACVGHNRCECAIGYKGAMCQNAICDPPCGDTAVCNKPGQCQCKPGYTGRGCRRKAKHVCPVPCLNGGRCRKGKCKCSPTHWGRSCQHLYQHIWLTYLNRTER